MVIQAHDLFAAGVEGREQRVEEHTVLRKRNLSLLGGQGVSETGVFVCLGASRLIK